jgi:dihydrofolate synthase/folylpolyglutamate synthase
VPLVTLHYPDNLAAPVEAAAAAAGALWLPRGRAWDAKVEDQAILYSDARHSLRLPLPRLAGAHQGTNAGLAVAMLRHQQALDVPEAALRAAMGWAEWPARLQQLGPGPLRDLLPAGAELWLDGAHNPAAARAVADHFRGSERPFHLVFGLLANKDAPGVLHPFRGRALTLHAVPVPEHEHHAPAALAATAREMGMSAMTAGGVEDALGWIARHADRDKPRVVLIMGSLYLAGGVLAANGQEPV